MTPSINPREITEVVYLPEMDKDSRKLIQEVTRVLQERPTEPTQPTDAAVDNSELARLGLDLNTAQNDIKWVQRVGWGVASLVGVGFVLLLTFYIPNQIAGVKNDINAAKTEEIASTAAQLSPISSQVAVMNATLDLLKPDIQKRLGQSLKNRAKGEGSQLRLNLQTADELAKQALENSIKANPKEVGEAGTSFVQVADKVDDKPDRDLAWQVVSQVINYRSYLFSDPIRYVQVKTFPPCSIINAGTVMTFQNPGESPRQLPPIKGNSTHDCAIDLEKHPIIKGMTCENCLVKYSGGPITLQDVTFKNCIFLLSLELVPPESGKKFSEALLASNLDNMHIASIGGTP
jgi:hypothetical protein